MLFLIHEKSKTLKGIMAVGPDSGEEAGRIWSTVSQSKGTLLDVIAQLQASSHVDSLLNTMVKKIELPLLREHCILVRTVREGKPFNVQVSQTNLGDLITSCDGGCALGLGDGCPVSDQLSRNPGTYSFATLPLWGKGKVIGVILVDNLYNQNPITEEDLHFLTLFSNQAGMAIENARLYRNLEEMHEELKETQALLVQHEKMAALGELSDTIAHELRNPLVSIGGFARRLYRAVTEEGSEKRYAQTIMAEVARIEKILNDVTQYTHKDSPVSKACDLQEILESSLSMISEEYKTERLQMVNEFAPDLPRVMGDDRQLKQAFFNLFANACQAMNGNGTLSVRATPDSRNGTSYLRVEVKDTGNGIDPETLSNIFNPFYSTKESSLGMGLAIVHKIVTSHGGQIQVDNRPGDGATFIVTFPIAG
jgi:signal transduction histidine kinase